MAEVENRTDSLKKKVERIAGKCADLVEKRIESTKELTGDDLHDIYSGIQMLGHITMTLERFNRMEIGIIPAAESYPERED